MPTTITTSTNALATALSNNSLVTVAADGTALVLFFDGTNAVFSYAASPYTSWSTKANVNTVGSRRSMSIHLVASDNVTCVCPGSSGFVYYRAFTKSGSTYTIGSAVNVENTVTVSLSGTTQPLMAFLDAQGREWAVFNASGASKLNAYESATPGIASWTVSLANISAGSDGNSPAAALCGNYLTIVFYASGGTMQWQRIDASAATLGSWTTAANLTGGSGLASTTPQLSFRGNSNGKGCLAYAGTAGIVAQIYNANTDTWGSYSTLSSNTSSVEPCTVAVNNDFYVFWCENNAANDFSLVYKRWDAASSTWDGSATVVVGSGTNIHNPNVGFGNETLVVIYTVGTATPWNVNAVAVNLVTKNGMGRSSVSVNTTLNGMGRVAISTGGTATVKNGLGRARLSITKIRTGVGRALVSAQSLPHAMGRGRLAILHSANALGRLLLKAQTSKNGAGRLLSVVRRTQNALGRLYIGVKSSRNGLGRVLLKAQTIKTALGRMRVSTGTVSTHNALGRVRASVLQLRKAGGRALLGVAALRSAVGRIRLAATATRSAMGRMSHAVGQTRRASGRSALARGRTLAARGRSALAVQHIQRAAGRVGLALNTVWRAFGRMHIVLVHIRNASGRLALTVTLATPHPALGRMRVQVVNAVVDTINSVAVNSSSTTIAADTTSFQIAYTTTGWTTATNNSSYQTASNNSVWQL